MQAQRNLDQAQLNLKYCDILAEIDGVVTRRDVNPGNNVIVGQSLMAIRSLTDIWIDANFKETQLASLPRIALRRSRCRYLRQHPAAKGAESPASPWAPARHSLFCPPKTPPEISLRSSSTPRAYRSGRLRSRQSPALHRSIRNTNRLHQPGTDRTRRREDFATISSHDDDSANNPTMTALSATLPLQRRAINPWLIAVAVVIPTFMEVLDTTIANVTCVTSPAAYPPQATDSEWVITSYLAANAIILPISGWLGTRLGRRNYFLLSIAVFTIASMLCGLATSLGALIAFRVLQGLAGGGLQPSSQGVLLDAFPPEKQGTAQTVFGIAALLAPVVGPTLGGYITDNYGWRWIFLINVPVGLLAFFLCNAVVVDPEYLTAQRKKMRQKPLPFDTIGLCLLAVTMVSWEVLLSKGQEWDWLGDPFFRVQTLILLFVICLSALIYRELRIANPLINFRTLLDRNFRSCCIIIFCASAAPLCQHHNASRIASNPVRLRRHYFRARPVTRRNLRRPDALHRRIFPLPANRCPDSNGHRASDARRRKLLDVSIKPQYRPRQGMQPGSS